LFRVKKKKNQHVKIQSFCLTAMLPVF